MLVRNRTGITQMCSPPGITLLPNEWTEVPYEVAMLLWRKRLVDVSPDATHEKYLWKEPDGTYLHWLSPFSMGDGYATAAENMVHALVAEGVKIFISQCWFVGKYGLLKKTVKMLDEGLPGPMRVGLCMATPGEFQKLPTPYRIGLTMYESDDPLANVPEWRHQCNEVDLLLVPSEYCVEVFSKFVRRPILVAPLAVNPIYYVAQKRKSKKTFTFVTHGTLSGRKAPLELIDCFLKAFPTERDVRLILKTRLKMCGMSQGQLPPITDARIKIISKDYLPNKMLGFLLAADAYVYLSKGEGYGLPPREAMATGLPTIFAKNTGMLSMASAYNWPVPTAQTVPSPLGGNWQLCDYDYAIEAMRWVYHNRDEAYERGVQGAKWFIENHGAASAAQRLVHILNEIDPFTTSGRRAETQEETLTSGAGADHKSFFEAVVQSVSTRAGVLLDIGMSGGQGIAYRELQRWGYDVLGVVEPGKKEAVTQRLLDDGVQEKDIRILEHPLHRLGSAVITPVAGCVCHSVLQNYTDVAEIKRLVGEMHQQSSEAVFISVPLVSYPTRFCEGAQLFRQAYWKDMLASYVADYRTYGKGKRYLRIQVLANEEGARGGLMRHKGRFIDHTWRHPRGERNA